MRPIKFPLGKILILIVFFLIISFSRIYGLECTTDIDLGSRSEKELYELMDKCGEKLNALNQQRNTLASEIQYMDTQIYLTGLRIQDTEKKILSTEKEIEILGSRIEGLDQSLDRISKLMLNKIVLGYKQKPLSVLGLIFDSGNADDLLTKIKYVKTVRDNNQKLLIQVQQAKSNFEEQKSLREEKKVELDRLTLTLSAQKQDLDNQKVQKQKLLTDTQNDEATYQRIVSQARTQLAGFKSFVVNTGAGVISANQFGNGSDGSYYSQRDARWADQKIGGSAENILNVGCLLTSVAMVAKKNGSNTTPADIASEYSRFFGSTAYMKLPWAGVAGKSYYGGVDIDSELSAGNYVIVGVGGCGSGGSHFVVLTKKDGDDYIMHDPIYGPDIKFSAHYSNICSSAVFK